MNPRVNLRMTINVRVYVAEVLRMIGNIDRQEIIHILRERQKYESDLGFSQGLQYAIDVARQIPMAECWIPCRERMPETEGRYLVYDSVMKTSFITKYYGDGKWTCVIAEITHWMPLPVDP